MKRELRKGLGVVSSWGKRPELSIWARRVEVLKRWRVSARMAVVGEEVGEGGDLEEPGAAVVVLGVAGEEGGAGGGEVEEVVAEPGFEVGEEGGVEGEEGQGEGELGEGGAGEEGLVGGVGGVGLRRVVGLRSQAFRCAAAWVV